MYQPVTKGEFQSPIMPMIAVMGYMSLVVFGVFVAISVISTLVCWIQYLLLRKEDNISIQVDFKTESREGRRNKLFLNATLEGAWRPILGYVQGMLIYDGQHFTGRFGLMGSKEGDATTHWRKAITGKAQIALSDIKEYEINGGFIYFQDMLRLFSFAAAQPVKGHFFQPPLLVDVPDMNVFPRKTENLDVRIEQMRRVEGELFNYKDFEAGDDIRRIVWKLYAKNNELMVRTPEIFEPYASHMDLYASFYDDSPGVLTGGEYKKEMLNYYKNCVYTVYDTLSKKEWKVNFVPDQFFKESGEQDASIVTAQIISNANWQVDKTISGYFNPKTGSVLCVHSFVDPVELEAVLDRCDATVVVYFVKLSRTFRQLIPLRFLLRIIMQPPKDRLNRLKGTWPFSPFNFATKKREKQIEQVLEKSAVSWTVL